jgi:hypothetical protein
MELEMTWRIVLLAFVLFGLTGTGASAQGGLAALRSRIDPTTLPKIPAACVDGKSGVAGSVRQGARGSAHGLGGVPLEGAPLSAGAINFFVFI